MAGERDDWLRRNAGRLLREAWQSPTALAQELYTIIGDTPDAAAATALPAVRARRADARIALPPSPPAQARPRSPEPQPAARPRLDVAALQRAIAGPTAAPAGFPPTSAAYPIGSSPPTMAPPFPELEWLVSIFGEANTAGLEGQVQSSLGGTLYSVLLYPNGSQGVPGLIVNVNVLGPDSAPTLDVGTWIGGIQQFTNPGGASYYEAIESGAGGTTTYEGLVVGPSGGGGDYDVTLYPDGSQGAPGKGVVVTVLQLNPTDTLPTGMWLTGIQKYTVTGGGTSRTYYECTVPVWME